MKLFRSTMIFSALLLILSAGASKSLAQTNMLANPGFEDNGGSYDGWFTFGSGVQLSTTETDNIIRTGFAASKCYGEYTNCDGGSGQFTVGGFGQLFTPIEGNVYTLGGYSFVSSADTIPGENNCDNNRMVAKVVFFDAAEGGNEICGNEIVIGDYSTARDQWIRFTVSAIAPAGALRVEALFLFLQPLCDDGSVFVDDTWLIETTPTAGPNILHNPSFDKNLTGWDKFGNVYYEGRSWALRTPTGCAKLYGTFVSGADSGIFQTFDALPGSIWKFGTNAMTTCRESPIEGDNDNFITAKLVFCDADTVEIASEEAVILDATSPMGTWTHHDLVGTAPEGTEMVRAYILFISPSLLGGAGWIDDISLYQGELTDVDPTPQAGDFRLNQNYPNPFNPTTRIDFELSRAGTVELSIYDVAGRFVANLYEGHLDEGPHYVIWNGKTAGGANAAAGVYMYVLKTETGQASKRMVLLR